MKISNDCILDLRRKGRDDVHHERRTWLFVEPTTRKLLLRVIGSTLNVNEVRDRVYPFAEKRDNSVT